MQKFDHVLLASDFDNTLVYTQSALDNGTDIPPMCPRNREALDYFIQNGGLFAISTGRALPAFMDYAKDVPMSAPCVIANGAAIYDFRANEYLYTAFLGEAIYDHMAEVLARFPTLAFEVYHDDCRIHAMNPNRYIRNHEHLTRSPVQVVERFTDIDLPIIKILFEEDFPVLDAVRTFILSRPWGREYELIYSNEHLLELTAAGKVYANYLEDSSQLYEQLLQDFTRLNASRRQTLRVAMSNWRASTLLPSILPAFSQEHPEAHLELLERPTSEMFRLVADNTVDFAIMNTNLNTPDYLTTETILYEKILLVGNRGNRAAQALAEACRAGREPELSVLEHERFVLLYPEILLAMRVNNFLEREHITVENALYTTNATTALNLTAENYGFCFVNETAVHNAPNRGELLFFDLDSPDLVHPLSVVYKKKRHLLPAARAFVDAARRFLQSQSWRSECDCRVEHGRPV